MRICESFCIGEEKGKASAKLSGANNEQRLSHNGLAYRNRYEYYSGGDFRNISFMSAKQKWQLYCETKNRARTVRLHLHLTYVNTPPLALSVGQ
jgi:hypothetical protein